MKRTKFRLEKTDLIVFSRQLALIIDSQVSLHEGLLLIQNKSGNGSLSSILQDVINEIDHGASLKDALNKYEDILSPFFIHMIDIGEKSGNLVMVLEQIGDIYEKELETTKKVKAAVSYPIILSLLMLGVVILLVSQVLPMFSDVLISLGGTMPWITKTILDFSLFIGNNILIFLGLIIIIMLFLLSYKKTDRGVYFFDRLKFYMPIQRKIISALTASRFARNLSILIKSGINIRDSFKMMKPVMNNKYIETKIDSAIEAIDKGKTFDDIMEKMQLYPWILIKLFSVAQLTGHIDDVLEKAAQIMEQETDNQLKRLTTVIEPALIMILSIIIGIILISVVLPIVNIMNSIG